MAEYIFLSSTHGTYTKTDHILSDKTNHNKFKRSESTECVFSDHNRIRLNMNNRKLTGNISKYLEARQYTSKIIHRLKKKYQGKFF